MPRSGGDVDNDGGWACVGVRGKREISAPYPQFCCEQKMVRKKWSLNLRKQLEFNNKKRLETCPFIKISVTNAIFFLLNPFLSLILSFVIIFHYVLACTQSSKKGIIIWWSLLVRQSPENFLTMKYNLGFVVCLAKYWDQRDLSLLLAKSFYHYFSRLSLYKCKFHILNVFFTKVVWMKFTN